MAIRSRALSTLAIVTVATAAFVAGWFSQKSASDAADLRDHPPAPITTRNGQPAIRLIVSSKDFHGSWPYSTTKATLEATMDGACLVELDGILYALNGTAELMGFPKSSEAVKGGMDDGVVRDMALQIVSQLRVQSPYPKRLTGNPILDP